MDAQHLVKLAMTKTGKTSQNQLAIELGVSHVAVGKWLRGDACPTFEQAAELALLAGLPPVATAAAVRQHSPDGMRHSALLKRMAGLAALITLAVGITPAHANTALGAHKTPSLYIMSKAGSSRSVAFRG
jgi:hypothetical protein